MNQEDTPPDDAAAKAPDPDEGRFLTREVALYGLAYLIGIAIMLLIPRLLNNMIMVMIVMLLTIYFVPTWLKRRRR
jgi:hypothetical protein